MPALLLVSCLFLLYAGAAGAAGGEAAGLAVKTEPSGGVRATAILLIPAPPSVVHQVLTDYEQWPNLFSVPLQVIRVERREGGAVTDLILKHSFLPGGRRLLCDNRELPGGGLVSTLMAGDFKRYVRTWTLAPDGDQAGTRASFDLLVEIETWAPDWLVAWELKRQLDGHFRILRATAAARARPH